MENKGMEGNLRRVVMFDTQQGHENLLPLSYTRPVADFRIGIRTIRQMWEELLPGEYAYQPVDYQQPKFGVCPWRGDSDDIYFINGALVPDESIAAVIDGLGVGSALHLEGELLAYRGDFGSFSEHRYIYNVEWSGEAPLFLKYVFDVFLNNAVVLERDWKRITSGRVSASLGEGCMVIGDKGKVFIEDGAEVEGCIINVKDGPVYIGKDAKVMEGSMLRGPLAVCEHSQVKMGAKIYGGTTIGPWCKVGGEVQNAVIFGYSNKAHDGYLGNAVIGEWCNLGAGVNASNLKNDYSKIRIWNYPRHTFMRTELQFCGLIMGDHSKAGINSMFNTATVVGVGVNLHGAGFPRTFLPSFTEVSPAGGIKDTGLEKFYQVAERVMSRRGIELGESDRIIYRRVYEVASRYKK